MDKEEFENWRDNLITKVLAEIHSTPLETLTLPELNSWAKGFRVGAVQLSELTFERLTKEQAVNNKRSEKE